MFDSNNSQAPEIRLNHPVRGTCHEQRGVTIRCRSATAAEAGSDSESSPVAARPENRLWRKNRRPNRDGSIGVDPNRNFPTKWGYDNEGSSPDPTSETFRGAGPASEPETKNKGEAAAEHEDGTEETAAHENVEVAISTPSTAA